MQKRPDLDDLDDLERRCRDREAAARTRYAARLLASPAQQAFDREVDLWLESHRSDPRLK